MHTLYRLFLALIVSLLVSGAASAQIYEVGKDRPGGDLQGISGTPGPLQCDAACDANPACKAWTWVNPGVQGPQPACYLKSSIPVQKADACCTSGVKLVGALPAGAALGKDRPGSDFSSFNLPQPNPAACANACNGNAACKAWTYVNPGIQGPQAVCYLKNAIPAEVANSCCVSAVKLPPPPPPIPPGAQANRDRPGNDYAAFNLVSPNPQFCYDACQTDGSCTAWTYVKPGVQGPKAKCYLKNPTPAAVADNCCISGAKAGPPPPPLPPGAQLGKDRPGSDIASMALASANPQLCYNACQGNPNCKAWTYVRPGVQGPQARCYLKNPAPAAIGNPCCVSGLKVVVPPPLPPGAVGNQDRPGNDFQAINLASASPQLCYNACQANGACVAWTYVKPGVQGPQAKCYLKNPVPAAVANNCCVSGVKAGPPPPPLPPGAQNNRDRFGNDYASFNVPSGNAADCYNACQGDPNCRAWSLLKGPPARCFLKNPAPPSTPNNCCISGAKAGPPPPPPQTGGPFELNVNRPGGDYIDFASGGAHTALLCLAACQSQPACKAWTYVKPGFQGPQSHCYLKSFVPPAQISNCCVSGVKQ